MQEHCALLNEIAGSGSEKGSAFADQRRNCGRRGPIAEKWQWSSLSKPEKASKYEKRKHAPSCGLESCQRRRAEGGSRGGGQTNA